MEPELTEQQLDRQSDVDVAIFELVSNIDTYRSPLEWDIEHIGNIRDAVIAYIIAKRPWLTESDIYPSLGEIK